MPDFITSLGFDSYQQGNNPSLQTNTLSTTIQTTNVAYNERQFLLDLTCTSVNSQSDSAVAQT